MDLCIILILVLWQRSHISRLRKEEAEILDHDMRRQFLYLKDHTTMTQREWLDWLPVFEAADKQVQSQWPKSHLGHNAGLVRDQISNTAKRASP